jgi:hypothetical protein
MDFSFVSLVFKSHIATKNKSLHNQFVFSFSNRTYWRKIEHEINSEKIERVVNISYHQIEVLDQALLLKLEIQCKKKNRYK